MKCVVMCGAFVLATEFGRNFIDSMQIYLKPL